MAGRSPRTSTGAGTWSFIRGCLRATARLGKALMAIPVCRCLVRVRPTSLIAGFVAQRVLDDIGCETESDQRGRAFEQPCLLDFLARCGKNADQSDGQD